MHEAYTYSQVHWLGTVALMLKICIGLGILSIPSGFDILGLIPGVVCLLTIGAITTWSSYMVGVFKINHPEVYGLDDTGALLFGPIGRYVFGGAFCISTFIINRFDPRPCLTVFSIYLCCRVWNVGYIDWLECGI